MSGYDLSVVARIGEGLVAIDFEGDRAVWARAKLRKPATCAVSERLMPAGSLAYHPVGNQMHRHRRVDAVLVDAGRLGP